MSNKDILVCPICNVNLDVTHNYYLCDKCERKFPIQNNVGVLVPEPEKHLNDINIKMSGDIKEWFTSDQINAYDNGPYRFHIQKRITFLKKTLKILLEKKEKFDNVLDLGCGDGANLRWLKYFSKNLWATDYNLLRLERTFDVMKKNKIDIKIFLADIFSLPFEKNSFDLIFFNHVIEHLEQDLEALRNIYKITKPGGIVILGTPNEGSLAWRFAYFIEPKVRRSSDHVNFYTIDSLTKIAINAGFKIIQIEHIGWGIPIWKVDPIFRKYRFFDDIFEKLGRIFFLKQSTSLYLILRKE